MINLTKIGTSKLLYALVGVSMFYFLAKGFTYAFIGSYVPILFIITMIIIMRWSFITSSKSHRRALRFWAILILIWAIIRLGLWGFLKIDSSLTESHLREQFGIVQNAISILMFVIGFKILREVKKIKNSETLKH